MLEAIILIGFGLLLIAFGVIIVLVAITMASMRRVGKGKAKAAGIIMIGPIPIIFGTDKKSVKTVMALALSLAIALIIAFLVYWFLR